MKLTDIRDNPGARKAPTRVGRGIGSGKGKTGGRGVKGQTSRSGVSINGFEGGQMPLHRRLPKRGFNNLFGTDYSVVNVGTVQKAIEEGRLNAADVITAEVLVAAGLVRPSRDGVRLLAKGSISTKVAFDVAGASAAAVAAVEAAGGSVKVPAVEAVAE
ncbi:50S ribosomal protein L15 [Nitrospirillum sp. BR 11163]|jgi:large subunit ribosomal protein L15|uniref:50S ribosomal protein L15 n=1 Tax=Nitrospirillum sp. BR 11163 TaxID=3104323 RepID=UPI002AFE2095|nr:50S ribosomal protein L15 [Nitrospirillum sp. BR 11163]MEA1676714.1 50S ribosomal protein L15 [Nitrospirillum sp. BR 11163]